jgi:hypothetical protein
MAAVTLPAVGGSCLGLAPDGVAASTLLTEPAASDVVDDHPVIDVKVPHSVPDLHDLPARFVAGDDAAVSLSTTAGVLPVDRPDVAATDGRRPHPEQDLTGARVGTSMRTCSTVLSPGSRSPRMMLTVPGASRGADECPIGLQPLGME